MEHATSEQLSAERPFTALAAALIALIGFAHLMRVFAAWEVVVVGTAVPVWLSGGVAVVFLALAAMVWRESRH